MGKLFRMAVERTPNQVALVDPDRGVSYTYQDWLERVTTTASALESIGIEEGDRVCVILENRPELATIYWATQQIGAVFVPINFRIAVDELSYLLANIEPRVFFFSSFAQTEVQKAIDKNDTVNSPIFVGENVPENTIPYSVFLQLATMDFEPTWTDANDVSVILHTSGTTGRPKSVPRSHLNTYAASVIQLSIAKWDPCETVMGSMSLFHTMGFHTMTTTCLLNGTWVCEHFTSPETTLEYIADNRATCLHMVPTAYHDLVTCASADEHDFDFVRSVSYGGFSLSDALRSMILDTFDPTVFVNHYGSTEVYTHTVCSGKEQRFRCAGKPTMNTRVRVVRTNRDEQSPTATVERGELGEIIVDMASPEAFDGYLTADSEDNIVDGWFFTGDLGYEDDDENLFTVGRIDDMIMSGGENIYPVEIESVLERHDEVHEVAVVGLKHEKWNQAITAFVYPQRISDREPIECASNHEPIDFESIVADLDDFLLKSDEIANFKRPQKYVFVDEITKTNVGKILRRELRKPNIDVTVYAEVPV